MSDSPGIKSRRSPDIFRTVKNTLHLGTAREEPAELPVDYEASMRELVGNIKQQSDGDLKTQDTMARAADARPFIREAQSHKQITTLYDALDKENIKAATETIDAMGRAMNVEAADVLAILLEYPDDAVRAQAALTLGVLGQRDSVEPLIRALDDRSAQVCENAANALGLIGDNRAEIPLQKVPVDNPKVKRAAVNALARIENKRM
ncbi:MAG: HEAT repeat protein [Methanocella sp. PtaU1.Bin125]|nr:MAG: HEAT repeat protein [Methanocella sp. PtaU1.Bin125]